MTLWIDRRQRAKKTSIAVSLLACLVLNGQLHGEGLWTWIRASDETLCHPALAFERTFQAPSDLASAKIRFVSMGTCEVLLNGQRVGDAELKPGFTGWMTRESHEADVTELVVRGRENRLFAEVSDAYWRDLISGDSGRVGDRPNGFAAELTLVKRDGTQSVLTTGPDWSAAHGGTLVDAGIYEGETRDMTQEKVAWKPARVFDPKVDVVPARGVVRIRRDRVLRPYAALPFAVRPGERRVVDFGQNAAAREVFTVKGPRGCRVEIRHAEVLNADGTCYFGNLRRTKALTTYVLRGGEAETFRPRHTYYGFRYIEISVSDPVEFLDLAMEPISSVRDETATIVTSDERVNRIISCAEWSLRSNQMGVPTDCCNRGERLGWMGDACVSTAAACWLWDAREFYLEKVARDVRDLQRDDGAYSSLAPGRAGELGPDKYGVFAWSDAGVLIPYLVFRHYGCDSRLADHYPSLRRYGNWLEKSGGPFPGFWGDWLAFQRTGFGEPRYPYGSDKATQEFLAATYRVWDFRALSEMAAALGKTADASRFDADRVRALRAFREKFLDSDGCLRPAYACQTTYALALVLGLCPDEASRQRTADALELNVIRSGRRLMTGVLGTRVLLEALAENGKERLAYDLLLSRACPSWGYMVDHGATTLWERWDGILSDGSFNDPKMNSFNHADFACVLDWMYRTMAGIRPGPGKGGFDAFVLQPRPDKRIAKVEASYRTERGVIRVKSEYAEDGAWSYDYEIPPGAMAEVRLPDGTVLPAQTGTGRVVRAAFDLSRIPDVRIFRGDAKTTYRDPAVFFEDGVFHLFFTLGRVEDGDRTYSYTAQSESTDLIHWTPPRILTPRGQHLNYSSPGNVVRDGEDRVLCLQTYPTPGATAGKTVYANATARLFTMRTRDWKTWTEPELLKVKGDDVPVGDMGRMIDPYLLRDRDDPGLWRCFYKQNGVSFSTSRDLRHWTFVGKADAGENVCVLLEKGRYVMFHSPQNGIGVKTSGNAVDWKDEGPVLTLGPKEWPWSSGRITAGAVIDCRAVPGIGKYLMFFHGSSPIDFAPASLGLAWSDDLMNWSWPGKGR